MLNEQTPLSIGSGRERERECESERTFQNTTIQQHTKNVLRLYFEFYLTTLRSYKLTISLNQFGILHTVRITKYYNCCSSAITLTAQQRIRHFKCCALHAQPQHTSQTEAFDRVCARHTLSHRTRSNRKQYGYRICPYCLYGACINRCAHSNRANQTNKEMRAFPSDNMLVIGLQLNAFTMSCMEMRE